MLTAFEPAGVAAKQRLRIPSYPSGKQTVQRFYPLYLAGEPLDWMRAGSPIDLQTGVYLLHDDASRAFYVGSSVGNIRRTIARHFQAWHRPRPLSQYVTKFRGEGARMQPPGSTDGGVLFDRDTTSAAVFLVAPKASKRPLYTAAREGDELQPRQIEAWFYEHLCSRRQCLGINAMADDTPF